MKFRSLATPFIQPLILAAALGGWSVSAQAQATVGGIAPRSLLPETAAQIEPDPKSASQITATLAKDGVTVTIQPGPADYPGVFIHPAQGASWDLTPFGRVDASITNTGDKPLQIGLRVDNEGPWQENPWSSENLGLKPGQTQVVKVYFGYSFGGKRSYPLKSNAITKLMFSTGKRTAPCSFRINEIWASGSSGEKPPVDPSTVRIKPENGVIFGPALALDPAKQLNATNGAQASIAADKGLEITFPTGKAGEAVGIKPPAGAWSLTDSNEVVLKIKNTGQLPVTPSVRLAGGSGSTDNIAAKSPLAPGAETEVVVPFAPAVPPTLIIPAVLYGESVVKGTGTTFASNNVRAITITADAAPGAKKIEVLSIIGDAPPIDLPSWVGQKPPEEGDWVKTFDDEFDGNTVDLKKWNIYTPNDWDKRTHFSKDNLIVKDGQMLLHYEKKAGFDWDDPTKKQTDYACGVATTYGKWTQRYGYFESRMKLPKAPGLWPAFWLMPDRGAAVDGAGWGSQWKRGDTGNGGMEFDIMEFLSGWGPYHYNLAHHWDGYGKEHKANGSPFNYVQADKDGYITCGLLWTPGKSVYYCNGKVIATWENPRVSSVQSYIIFNMVSGGWDNLPLEDSRLPDDLVVKYVRVWQRKDLATPEDGPKPNNGSPTIWPSPPPAPAK